MAPLSPGQPLFPYESQEFDIVTMTSSTLHQRLENQIKARTGNRLKFLQVHLSPTGVVLTGKTNTYHVKQLALTGVREVVPDLPVRNEIEVF